MSKRTWNYRVIRHEYVYREEVCELFNIYSVHYDDDTPVLISTEPQYVQGNTLEELKSSLELQLGALDKPGIDYSFFENVEKDESDE